MDEYIHTNATNINGRIHIHMRQTTINGNIHVVCRVVLNHHKSLASETSSVIGISSHVTYAGIGNLSANSIHHEKTVRFSFDRIELCTTVVFVITKDSRDLLTKIHSTLILARLQVRGIDHCTKLCAMFISDGVCAKVLTQNFFKLAFKEQNNCSTTTTITNLMTQRCITRMVEKKLDKL